MVSLGIFDIFIKKKGIGIAMIGLICIFFVLTAKNFSFTAKVIVTVFGVVMALFGMLLETPLLRNFQEGHFVPEFND